MPLPKTTKRWPRASFGIALLCLFPFAAGVPVSATAQAVKRVRTKKEPMTNARVIKLFRLGVSEADILERIRGAKPRFDVSAKGLRQLRRAGVAESLISKMISFQGGTSAAGAVQQPVAPCAASAAATEAKGARPEFERLPASHFYQLIRADESSTYRLPPVSVAGGAGRSAMDKRMRVGDVRPLTPPLTAPTNGKCFDLGTDGFDVILAVVSAGARQVRVRLAAVDIPPGARVFVYSTKNRSEIHGPYEGRGPSGDGSFWTPPVEGDEAVIEYHNPRPVSDPEARRAAFQVIEVSHVYAL